jgi:hypothetical protein
MLRLLFVPAALAVVLAGPACGSKKEPPPAPAEPAQTAVESARPPAKPPAPAPAPVPAPATADGKLPAACTDYRETIERLAQCGGGLPQETRDALKASFERDWAGWQKTGSAQAELEAACKHAADNVKVAASAACGW